MEDGEIQPPPTIRDVVQKLEEVKRKLEESERAKAAAELEIEELRRQQDAAPPVAKAPASKLRRESTAMSVTALKRLKRALADKTLSLTDDAAELILSVADKWIKKRASEDNPLPVDASIVPECSIAKKPKPT